MSVEQWYVQREDGTVDGPFLERDVAVDLLSGKIGDHHKVRQGASGAWCDSARARAVFQQLAEVGWYVRTADEQFGPFTEMKLLDLHRAGDLAGHSELRQGLAGKWKPAETVLCLWRQQNVSKPSAIEPSAVTQEDVEQEDVEQNSDDVRKWSIEPIRHVVMPLETKADTPECEPFERLLLNYPSDDESRPLLIVTTNRGETLGLLSENNSRQVIANSERGLSHVTLLYSRPGTTPLEVALVLCPPGIDADVCRNYIDAQFRQLN